MISRTAAVSLIILGLLVLGLGLVAHVGPIEIPGHSFFVSVELTGSAFPVIAIGSVLMVLGVAIELRSPRKK